MYQVPTLQFFLFTYNQNVFRSEINDRTRKNDRSVLASCHSLYEWNFILIKLRHVH